MNFALSDEQEFLKEAARGVVSRFNTLEAAREALDGGELPDLWPAAVEAGWPGLLVAEDRGGAGLAPLEAMLVFEELGRVLAGVPLLGHLPATLAARPRRRRRRPRGRARPRRGARRLPPRPSAERHRRRLEHRPGARADPRGGAALCRRRRHRRGRVGARRPRRRAPRRRARRRPGRPCAGGRRAGGAGRALRRDALAGPRDARRRPPRRCSSSPRETRRRPGS